MLANASIQDATTLQGLFVLRCFRRLAGLLRGFVVPPGYPAFAGMTQLGRPGHCERSEGAGGRGAAKSAGGRQRNRDCFAALAMTLLEVRDIVLVSASARLTERRAGSCEKGCAAGHVDICDDP
jgi:hypothetical protein